MPEEEIVNITEQEPEEEVTETEQSPLPRGVKRVSISSDMEKAYLDYAMSVIVSRAIPDVRDGLKPVQRRILFAMFDTNTTHEHRYSKSAATIGEVMKKYHPHGDMSIYDAMVRMAQEFSMRYPLIDGQGNFGSIDGDPPAAYRYTEARLEKITKYLYQDINSATIDFNDNYSAEFKEPSVMPSLLPNFLLNGTTGIAVGMATQVPPHNLGELIDGIFYLIDHLKTKPAETIEIPEVIQLLDTNARIASLVESAELYTSSQFDIEAPEVGVDELIQFIKGPDFPTRCTIYDITETKRMYATGKGRIIQRAKVAIEEHKNGKFQLIATELPFQVNKATLVEKIANLVKDKKIQGITDLRDESDRDGIRVVVEISKTARPQKILNFLYKHTDLQTAFNANIVGLVHDEPKVLTLKTILEEFVKHRRDVIIRRTIYLLNKAREREHILEGLKKALDIIDQVIATIRASKSSEDAKINLVEKYEFTTFQAEAILEMQLRKLAALERQKLEDELNEIKKTIGSFKKLLSKPENLLTEIKRELQILKDEFGDVRKTKVIKGKIGEFSEEDFVADEQCIVTLTKSGYMKRVKTDTYKIQGRGGKGVRGSEMKEEDQIDEMFTCSTHDQVLLFNNKGKVFSIKAWDIPETSRTARGTPVINLIDITPNETISGVINISKETKNKYLVLATKNGVIKKTAIDEFKNIRVSGIIALKLKEDDELGWVKLSKGDNEVMIFTRQGQSIRFSEKDVRPMGRSASGVKGITLKKQDDKVVGIDVIEKGRDYKVLIISENGYGKRTNIKEYKVQKRSGSGIKTYNISTKTGIVAEARILSDNNKDLLIVSQHGQVIKIGTKQINVLGRSTSGVKVINLNKSDKVATVAETKIEEEVIAEEE
ncbi:MAG: DNA gyrase subunit A [bacterium]|nr:DNA gyrase subunit A [bacterium]